MTELRETNPVSGYNKYDMYKAMRTSTENRLGDISHTFSDEFIAIFDVAILTDNKYIFSPEQQRVVDTYFTQADGQLDSDMVQLDKFLGEYIEVIGEENG